MWCTRRSVYELHFIAALLSAGCISLQHCSLGAAILCTCTKECIPDPSYICSCWSIRLLVVCIPLLKYQSHTATILCNLSVYCGHVTPHWEYMTSYCDHITLILCHTHNHQVVSISKHSEVNNCVLFDIQVVSLTATIMHLCVSLALGSSVHAEDV